MKRVFFVLTVFALALAMTYGCGTKETKEADKVPTEVKQAEQMDTTRMDSAVVDSAVDSMTDSMEIMPDSM